MQEQNIFNNILRGSSVVLENYAEKRTVYENLQDMLKPVLAQCVAKYTGSEAKKEKQALADPEYLQFLDGLAEARKGYHLAWAKYENLKTQLAVAQSMNKIKVVEMKSNTFKT